MLIIEGYKIQNYSEHMSDDELFTFCSSNKALRIERDKDQNIIIMSPVGGLSGFFEQRFIAMIAIWELTQKKGVSFSSATGFLLPNGAMRSPDGSWVSDERWNTLKDKQKEKFLPIVPDFVVEVRSQSDQLKNLKEKMEEWIDNGVRLAWLIDYQGNQAFIYRPNHSVELLEGLNQTLSGENVMKGFEFDLNLLRMP